MREAHTKDRILDAAERLFGKGGVGGTSLRAITAEAGVNVAAVHYHFGSKDALLRALVTRRVAPVNRERLQRLERLQARSRPPSVDDLLEAFLRPAFEARRGDPHLAHVVALLYAEPIESAREIAQEAFGEVGRCWTASLARALPHLDATELGIRFQFVVGVLVHLLGGRAQRELEPGGAVLSTDEKTLQSTIRFLAAGLRVPTPGAVDPAGRPGRGR